MVVSLFAMQNGYFDDVAVSRVKECQTALEEYFNTRKELLLNTIANDKSIDKCADELKQALADFKASWK